MFSLLLLFLAPAIQIILSILRLKGTLKLPQGVTAIIAFASGVAFTIISINIFDIESGQTLKGPRCGMGEFAVLLLGSFVILIFTPLIEAIFYFITKFRNKQV